MARRATVDRTIYDGGVIDVLSRWSISTGEVEECKWFSLACQARNVAFNAGFFLGSDMLVEVDQKSPDEDPCLRMPRSRSSLP